MSLKCLILGEGPTDLFIQQVTKIVIQHLCPNLEFEFATTDDSIFCSASGPLEEQVAQAIAIHEDIGLMLIHRDADSNQRTNIEARRQEIQSAAERNGVNPFVCVVPVKETEAWMLADKDALLRAVDLKDLPVDARELYPKDPESSDAKKKLKEILKACRKAAGWKPRHYRISDDLRRIGDELKPDCVSKLNRLASFQRFQEDLNDAINSYCS